MQQTQQHKAWRAFCLLEKAVKKGRHVQVKSQIFDIIAPDPESMMKYLTDPVEAGGKGVYKVLFYCDGESVGEQKAFNTRRTAFMQQFQPHLPGDIEI